MASTNTLEQLVDIINQDCTMSGLFPRILPDAEIKRIIKEEVLEWFYKSYQFAVQKSFYYLKMDCIFSEEYTAMGYITLPEEIEGITRIAFVNDPSLFQIGIQAPNLSINFGVTNQPYLTSFVTNVGELGTYRAILSYFSDELNKMSKNFVRHSFNHISKRLHFLDAIETNMMLEVYARIPQEDLFDNVYFKQYCFGYCEKRMGEAIGRFGNFSFPGGFSYNASDIIIKGEEKMNKVEEKIKGETQSGWFYMSK